MSKSLTGIGITVFDADARGGDGTLRLQCSVGTIDVTVGNSGVVITSGDTTNNVLLTGTMRELDNLMRGSTTGTVVFTSATLGAVTFTLTATDEDGQSSVITFGGTIATYAAPVVTMPSGTLTANVDEAFTLEALSGWNITDADDADGYGNLYLSCVGGTLTAVTGTSGATILDGTFDGFTFLNGTNSIRLQGTITSLRTFLQSPGNSTLRYTPNSTGTRSVTAIVVDSNGQISNTGTKNITVRSAPNVTAPTAYLSATAAVNKDIHGTGFSYVDSDASGSQSAAIFTSNGGAITVAAGDSGVTGISGNGTGVVTFSGTVAQINHLLQDTGTGTIVYLRATAATDTITVQITDNDGLSGSDVVTIVVAASETWTGYVSATPTGTTATISNFVAPIDLSLLPQAWWDIVSADGRDIRVTLSTDDTTPIPRDLVHFSKTLQTGVLFTKITNSATPPTLHIWAGAALAVAPADGDADGREAVYDSSLIRAWWPDGGGVDRTQHDNDLTAVGGVDFGGVNADFGYATDYGSSNTTKYATCAVSIPADEPELFCAFINAADRTHETVMGATHDTKTNVLRLRQSKVTARSIISNASGSTTSDNHASAVGDIEKGAWKFVAASFLSDTNRSAYRESGNIGTNNTAFIESGSAGDLYMVGATVKNPTTVVSDTFRGKIGLCYVLTGLASNLISDWVANYSGAFDQASYWTPWTFSAGSQTGL